ncbi:MAG: hypothetical protein ACRYG4_13465 [Janthinobacterium lividum]
MKRIPLWLTVVPLVVGGGFYWHLWSGYRDTLRADIARYVPASPVKIGGFPYRMEATIGAPTLFRDGDIRLALRADSATANRGPWQRDLTVVRTANPVVDAAIPALAGVRVHLTAASAISSLHLAGEVVARQSNVFNAARIATGLFAAPVTATSFEVHLRETRARSNEAWSPTPPQQAQVVLTGTGVRIGGGDPLTLAADAGITSTARLRGYAGWADGGTVELHSLTLGDAAGEIVRLAASAVAAKGQLRVVGTVATVCPATLAAAFAGSARPSELRLRVPVTLAFSGTPGAFQLAAMPAGPPRPVRAQIAKCPRLS